MTLYICSGRRHVWLSISVLYSSFSLNNNDKRVHVGCQYAEPDRKLDQTNQIQRLDETETETQATQDRTTQDLTAPRFRTADESQIQVGAETVKVLQASQHR